MTGAPLPVLPGRLGARYRILGVVAEGGFGTVFRARDLKLDRDVALKLLRDPEVAPGAVARFEREARLTAGLVHPHIVPVLDSGVEAGVVYIVYALLQGIDAERMVASRGALEPLRVARWGTALAEALAAAHGVGVIHRDVKPSNVVVVEGDRPVLCDFGIARDLAGRTLTSPDLILGTPGYMAPELWRGEPVSFSSDQYSLAATLLHLATGQAPPLPGRDGPVPLAARIPEELVRAAPGLAGSLRVGLDPDPGRRFPDLAALAASLAKTTTETLVLGAPASGPTVGTPAPKHRARRHRPAGWIAGFFALAVLGFLATRPDAPPASPGAQGVPPDAAPAPPPAEGPRERIGPVGQQALRDKVDAMEQAALVLLSLHGPWQTLPGSRYPAVSWRHHVDPLHKAFRDPRFPVIWQTYLLAAGDFLRLLRRFDHEGPPSSLEQPAVASAFDRHLRGILFHVLQDLVGLGIHADVAVSQGDVTNSYAETWRQARAGFHPDEHPGALLLELLADWPGGPPRRVVAAEAQLAPLVDAVDLKTRYQRILPRFRDQPLDALGVALAKAMSSGALVIGLSGGFPFAARQELVDSLLGRLLAPRPGDDPEAVAEGLMLVLADYFSLLRICHGLPEGCPSLAVLDASVAALCRDPSTERMRFLLESIDLAERDFGASYAYDPEVDRRRETVVRTLESRGAFRSP